MLDIAKLSSRYEVCRMGETDADAIYELFLENMQYFRYCGKEPDRDLVLNDLRITPPGKDLSSKYYVGFYDGEVLTAVMDLIDGYPDRDYAFIGFFMMKKDVQGKGTGSGIVSEVCRYLKEAGFSFVRLAIDKGNPQSTHFWKKNGFRVVKEVDRDGWTVLVADREL